jgi:hypothetical protein
MDDDYDYAASTTSDGLPPPPPPPYHPNSSSSSSMMMMMNGGSGDGHAAVAVLRNDNEHTAAEYGVDIDHSALDDDAGGAVDGDEALLDLAQLEELHQEAERMKALGNKHMAAQVNVLF